MAETRAVTWKVNDPQMVGVDLPVVFTPKFVSEERAGATVLPIPVQSVLESGVLSATSLLTTTSDWSWQVAVYAPGRRFEFEFPVPSGTTPLDLASGPLIPAWQPYEVWRSELLNAVTKAKGDSLRNPTLTAGNVLKYDYVRTNPTTGAETVTPVTVGTIATVEGGLTPAQKAIFDDLVERVDEVEAKPTTELKEHTLTATTAIPVKDNGTYLLHATSTHTVSFTGAANGSSIAIVADFPFRVAGTTYSAGLHVALRLPSGWDVVTVRGSVPDPVVNLTGTTQTTASVTWSAVPGATSYLARVNASGSGVDIGNVTSWTAEGLPLGQTGTIGIRAVGPDGMSAWVTVPFTTSTPAASVLRMAISHPDSTSETGNATAGYNYVFNSTPYGEGLTSNFWRIPANANGFAQGVVTASTAGGFGFHFSDSGQSPHGGAIPSTVGISVPVIGGGNTYTAAADPPQPASELVAAIGDIIRIGRTGTTLWVRVSKNGGSTFTEIYSRLSTVNGSEAMPVLFLRVSGLNFSGTLSNVRGVGWVAA